MSRRRTVLRGVRVLLLLAAALLAAEAALRLVRLGPSRAAFGRWQPRARWSEIRTLEERGPWPRPGGRARWALQAGSPEIEYRLDAHGFRVAADAALRRGGCRVLAIGDSNVFGYGVPAEDSFPAILEMLLLARGVDAEVRNAGVCASDAAQQERWLEAAVERVSPQVVIIAVSPWSLRTDRPQGRTDPTLVEKLAHALVQTTASPAVWSAVVDRTRRRLLHGLGAFTSWLPTSDAAWHLAPLLEPRSEFDLRFAAAADHVRRMVERSRARNLTPFLVFVPLDVQTTTSRNHLYAAERLPYPSWGFVDRDYTRDPRYADDMARLAKALAVPLIDVTERLVTRASGSYLQDDYHLSEAGHRRIAEEITAPVRDACVAGAVASGSQRAIP